jgi:hypothetical protein
MKIEEALTRKFIADELSPYGIQLYPDLVFRTWSHGDDICAIVAVRTLHARSKQQRYTVDICFLSRFINRCFGVPVPELPMPSRGPNIFFRIDELVGRKLGEGWAISDAMQLSTVGEMFRQTFRSRFGDLFQRFMTIDGWIEHFRRQLASITAGRGLAWTLLGYSLLARDSSLEELEQVLEMHSDESSGNRLDIHLERQRAMVKERFPKKRSGH